MRTDYWGAEFPQNPASRNDGRIAISNPGALAEALRLSDLDSAPESSIKNPVQRLSSATEDAQRKEQLKRQKLAVMRDTDLKSIRSKIEQQKKFRDDRFIELMAATDDNNELIERLDATLQRDAAHKALIKGKIHEKWLDNVYRPLQHQVKRKINPIPPEIEQELLGDMPIPPIPDKVLVDDSLDPMKADLAKAAKEEEISRKLERLLFEYSPNRQSIDELKKKHPRLFSKSAHSTKTHTGPESSVRLLYKEGRLDPNAWNGSVLLASSHTQHWPTRRLTGFEPDSESAGNFPVQDLQKARGIKTWSFPPGTIPPIYE